MFLFLYHFFKWLLWILLDLNQHPPIELGHTLFGYSKSTQPLADVFQGRSAPSSAVELVPKLKKGGNPQSINTRP